MLIDVTKSSQIKMNHIQDFGLSMNDRMRQIVGKVDPKERLEGLQSFYAGLVSIEDHSHFVGNLEGLKRSSMDLLQLVEKIKPLVLKEIDRAQCAVYIASNIQQEIPF